MGDGTKENPYTRKDVLRLIEECRRKGKVPNFSNQEFKEGIDLSGLNRPDQNLRKVIFTNAKLFRAYFEGSDLRDTDLREAHLEQANFNEANLAGTMLEGAYIEGVHLTRNGTHLGDVNWGNYIIGEEKEGEKKKWEERKRLLGIAEHRYRQLKAWYDTSGYGDTVGKFYYREKEAGRKRLKLLSEDWHHRIASELIRAIFGYGERWWNIVFSIEALILLFAFTYLAIAVSWEWWQILLFGWIPGLIIWFAYLKFATGLNWTWLKKASFWVAGMVFLFCAFYFPAGLVTSQYIFWRYLYFSTVSFTALGYGEWARLSDGLASDFIKGIGAFESLVGISMMALLLVTFFRKWTR